MIVFALLSAILAAFVVLLLVRHYLSKRRSADQVKNMQDVNVYKDNFDIVIDVVTVLVGIFSVFVSLVSIHVMRQQEKTQDMLVKMQQMEHQPTFDIEISAYALEENGPNAYEEFSITNVGRQMSSPAMVSVQSFIQVSYTDKDLDYLGYYPLGYYFNSTVSSKALTGQLVHSWGSFYSMNLTRFNDLRYATLPSGCNGYVSLKLVHRFAITYTDLYGDERTVYYENEVLSSEEAQSDIAKRAEFFINKKKSIADVTIDDLCEEIISIKNTTTGK